MTLRPPGTACTACYLPLRAYKTRGKTVHFPTASIWVKEEQRICRACDRIHASPEYTTLTPPRSNMSWGLIVEIGQARFHHNRQIQEIRSILHRRGIRIAASSIVRASDLYLERFVALHDDPALWNRLLPIPRAWEMDGTTDGGGGLVFVIRCGRYTVAADGVLSEASPNVASIIEAAKRRVGTPAAVVRDFSDGAKKALRESLPETPQIGCHFHFLRDAGNDLMGAAHVQISRLLAKDRTRARLRAVASRANGEWRRRIASVVEWALTDAGGPGFPFRRPSLDLVERMDRVYDWTCEVVRVGARENRAIPDVVALKEVLERYRLDVTEPTALAEGLRRCVGLVRRLVPWFEAVRDALRAYSASKQREADTAGLGLLLERIEGEARSVGREAGDLGLALVAAVRRRWQELFATVIVEGGELRVKRTIVATERSHRWWKQGVRRRTGRSRVAAALRHHGVALAFLQNWTDVEFRVAVGGVEGLVREMRKAGEAAVEWASASLARLRRAPGYRRRAREQVLAVPESVVAVEG